MKYIFVFLVTGFIMSLFVLAVNSECRGSSFVIWGRRACPTNAVTVYTGIIGGDYYDNRGGGVNRLCLTLKPMADIKASSNGRNSFIGGAEYENMIDANNDDQDAVCAVCQTSQPLTIMVPGTNACPDGWIKQYSGHLTAGYFKNVGSSEYICLHEAPENRRGGSANANGADLEYVMARCGSLPCPPYQENKAILCAVCSK